MMRAIAALTVALAAFTPALRAQGLATWEVVLETRLGGDSATATLLDLRHGSIYRVELRPAAAQVELRTRTRDGGEAVTLAPRPLPAGDSVSGGRGFTVAAQSTGSHVVMLTNPGVGAVEVRVVAIMHQPGDLAAVLGRRTLIVNEELSVAAVLVPLDTGVVYRIVSNDVVYVAPRMMSGAPVRLAPLVRGGGSGVAFLAPTPGEYRFFTDEGTATSLRIYREEADARELACVRDPTTPGCRRSTGSSGHRYAPYVGIGATLLIVMLFAGRR